MDMCFSGLLPASDRTCFECGYAERLLDRPIVRCSTCRHALYCSHECMPDAWDVHSYPYAIATETPMSKPRDNGRRWVFIKGKGGNGGSNDSNGNSDNDSSNNDDDDVIKSRPDAQSETQAHAQTEFMDVDGPDGPAPPPSPPIIPPAAPLLKDTEAAFCRLDLG